MKAAGQTTRVLNVFHSCPPGLGLAEKVAGKLDAATILAFLTFPVTYITVARLSEDYCHCALQEVA